MKLQKNVDFQHLDGSIFTLPQTDDKLDVSCNAPSASEITEILEDDYLTSSQDSQSSQESVPSSQLGDQSNIKKKSVNPSSELDYLLLENDESIMLTSQASQSSSNSDATIIDTEPPLTRSRMRLSNEFESSSSMLLETTTATLSEPRKKRLKLSFDAQHLLIPKYTQPTEMTSEMWICNVSNFVLSEQEENELDELHLKVLVEALVQIKGSNEDDGKYEQIVPPFKEIYSWEEPVIEKTNTVFLELIPGKPDITETVLYEIGKIKELFIDTLKYKYVMVCGNEKTVELLYRMKNEYGSEMKWMLVMLGTWHLLKDYFHIFLKKYEHVVVRHLFTKTKTNVDSLINSMKWWKSYNYIIWLISAVLRENVSQFLSHLGVDVSHALFKKAEVVVDALRRYSTNQDSLRSKFEKFL